MRYSRGRFGYSCAVSMPKPESRSKNAGHAPSLAPSLAQGQLALGARLGLVAIALTLETVLQSYLIQQRPIFTTSGLAGAVHEIQHWLFRFLIAYAAACALLYSLGRRGSLGSIGASHRDAPIRLGWLAIHSLLLIPL